MMKKILVLLTCLLIATSASRIYAQAGRTALGLRATPDGGGFTAKTYFNRNIAFEGQLNAGGITALQGFSLSALALLEFHIILPDPSWRIFMGGGLHGGVWYRDSDQGYQYLNSAYDDKVGLFGIDAIAGAEYVFKKIPLGLSADIKPAINFVSEVDFFPHNFFGLSARFYLSRSEIAKK